MESLLNHGHASAFASTGSPAVETTAVAQRSADVDTIGAQIQILATLLNRHLRNALRAEDLSAAHWKILKLVKKSGPISIVEMATALETGRHGIATLTDQLVGLGYLGGDPSGSFELSPVGQAVIQRIERTIRVQQDWLSVSIDSQDLATFKEICASLSNILKSGQMRQPNAIPEPVMTPGAAYA